MWRLKPLRVDPPRHDPRGVLRASRPGPPRGHDRLPPLISVGSRSSRTGAAGSNTAAPLAAGGALPRIRACLSLPLPGIGGPAVRQVRARSSRRQRHDKRRGERGNSARSLAFRRPTNGRARAGGPPPPRHRPWNPADPSRRHARMGAYASSRSSPRVAPLGAGCPPPRLRAARAYVPTCPAAVRSGPPVLCSPYSNVRARRAARWARLAQHTSSFPRRAPPLSPPAPPRLHVPGRAVVWLDPEGGGPLSCARRLPARLAGTPPAAHVCGSACAAVRLGCFRGGLVLSCPDLCVRAPAAGRRGLLC